MYTLTLLTACLPAQSDHFEETARSVQVLRERLLAEDNVELEWVVCYDGPGEVRPTPFVDKEIRLVRHCGVAVARNIALSQASGKYFAILDADDLIVYEGVKQALTLLEANDQVSWVACNRTFLDGSPTRHWHGKAYWGPKFLAWDWTSPFPFHPSSLVMRTDIALEIGGWPALSACEDVGFILEVSERHGGAAVTEVLSRHRAWDKQLTQGQGWSQEKELAYDYIETLLNNNRRKSRDPLITRPALAPIDAPV